MKKLIILSLGVLAICGCATESRHVDLIIPLTGDNSVVSADSIDKDICKAFITIANVNGVSVAK
jgi:hypothetical protein